MEIYKEKGYKEKGLEIVAFPCNQFGKVSGDYHSSPHFKLSFLVSETFFVAFNTLHFYCNFLNPHLTISARAWYQRGDPVGPVTVWQ